MTGQAANLRTLSVVLGLAVAIAVCLWLGARWLQRAGRRRTARVRSRRALQGERDAAGLLAELGYRVLQQQVPRAWTLEVDGAAHRVQLRADYLVSRGGRSYVAEVKTGHSAPHLDNPNTRRQLLEYRLAYATDGALLVDMEQRRVHEVRFEAEFSRAPGRLRWVLGGALLGVVGMRLWSWLP